MAQQLIGGIALSINSKEHLCGHRLVGIGHKS